MKYIFLILMFFPTLVFADSTFQVNTGFGYFEDSQGNVIAKATLPKGEHPIKDGYTYIEVDSKQEMDLVSVYVPTSINNTKEREEVINQKIREIAIDALKKDGKWKQEYDSNN